MTIRSKVLFPAPVEEDIIPPQPEKPVSKRMTYQEIQPLMARIKAAGFDENAIVVRRDLVSHYETKRFINWGIVSNVKNYHDQREDIYYPLAVLWFKDSSVTYCWPDDLYLLNDHMNHALLDELLEAQKIHGTTP